MFTKLMTIFIAPFLLLRAEFQRSDRTSCATEELAEQAAICVSTPHEVLTFNRNDAQITIYFSLAGSKLLTGRQDIRVTISAPLNPSGIALSKGQQAEEKIVSVGAGEVMKDVPLMKVATSPENRTSGTLTYTISTELLNTKNKAVVIHPQLDVEVKTVP